jgi:two-component system, sporulation sensor kinase E
MVRPHKIKKARSIRSDLFVLIVLIAFVPLVLYFLFDVFSLRRELRRDAYFGFENIAGHFGNDLTIFLSDRLNDLKLLSENPAIRSSRASYEEKMRQMNRVQEYYHYFDDITLVSVDGSVVLSTTYSFYSDLSKTSWFLEAKEGRAVITDPYRDLPGKDLMISFFLPIVDGGRIVSILSARMNMKEIWKRADSVKFGEFGRIIILDRYGTIIAHPDRTMILKKLDAAGITGIVEGGDRTLPVDFTDDDGVEYVGALVVMGKSPLYEMTPLLILAVQTKNEAYALSNYVLIRDLLEMVVVLSLIILVSLFFTARLTQPIQGIIGAAEKISGGELGAVVEVKSWREINDIAEAFNMMSLGLMDYTRELRESEERYRALVEDISDGYYLVKDDRLVFANEAAHAIFGYDRSEVIGRKIYDFIPKEWWDGTATVSREVTDQQVASGKIELPIIKKSGELIFIEAKPKLVSMGGDVLLGGYSSTYRPGGGGKTSSGRIGNYSSGRYRRRAGSSSSPRRGIGRYSRARPTASSSATWTEGSSPPTAP